jgi:polygalacturonase
MSVPKPRREILGLAAASAGVAGLFAQRTARAAEPPKLDAFDVRAFGAAGDGKTFDTPAINKTIEAAAAAGGGTVRFPAGTYLCYSIRLKSNVALHLEQGCTILAADPPAVGQPGYDPAENANSKEPWLEYQDFGHRNWHNSLMWGEGLSNISITGPGLIWGKGLSRGFGPGPRAETPGVANKTIGLKNCHNVILRDISILHGGHFCILATGVDNLTVDNVTMDTIRDGIDIDCCRNVRVSNCNVNSPWDDGICLKSSFGLGWAKPTEMVNITNCYVSGCWQEGTLIDGTFKPFEAGQRIPHTGRIKFGTESNGGFKNITISNCILEGSQALSLESVDGAIMEDVTITNISMKNPVTAPIFIRLGRRMRGPKDAAIGTARRITISNITVSGAPTRQGSIISGIPGHRIESLKLSNIIVLHEGGGTAEQAAVQVPEQEDVYPDPGRFGSIPAQGFFIRHVKDLEMDSIQILAVKPDARPVMMLDDVEGAAFAHVKTPANSTGPAFSLANVSDFEVRASRPVADTWLDRVEKKVL